MLTLLLFIARLLLVGCRVVLVQRGRTVIAALRLLHCLPAAVELLVEVCEYIGYLLSACFRCSCGVAHGCYQVFSLVTLRRCYVL